MSSGNIKKHVTSLMMDVLKIRNHYNTKNRGGKNLRLDKYLDEEKIKRPVVLLADGHS